MCVCARITPEKDYHKSNSNVINLLCVDRKEREEISLQLTVSVFGRGAQAGGRVIRLIRLWDVSGVGFAFGDKSEQKRPHAELQK